MDLPDSDVPAHNITRRAPFQLFIPLQKNALRASLLLFFNPNPSATFLTPSLFFPNTLPACAITKQKLDVFRSALDALKMSSTPSSQEGSALPAEGLDSPAQMPRDDSPNSSSSPYAMSTGLMELLKYNNQHHYDSDKDEVDSIDGDGSDGSTPSPVTLKPAKREKSRKPARKSPISPEKVLSTDESDSEDSDSIGDPVELGRVDQEEEGSDAMDSEGETEDDYGASDHNFDDNENESFRQPSVDLDRVACTDDCRHQFRAAFGTLEQQVSDLQDQIRSLTLQSGEKDRQIEGKNEEIERLKGKPVHRQRKTKRVSCCCLELLFKLDC